MFFLSMSRGIINPQEGLASFTHYPGGLAPPLTHYTQGNYHHLEGIITSHAITWGIINPQIGYIITTHTLPWGISTPKRGLLPLIDEVLLSCSNLRDYQPLESITASHPLLWGISTPREDYHFSYIIDILVLRPFQLQEERGGNKRWLQILSIDTKHGLIKIFCIT